MPDSRYPVPDDTSAVIFGHTECLQKSEIRHRMADHLPLLTFMLSHLMNLTQRTIVIIFRHMHQKWLVVR